MRASKPTLVERVTANEQREKTIETRLDGFDIRFQNIETSLSELAAILTRARNVKWFFDGTFKYVGYIATIGAAGVAIWKFWIGH
jgi:hypothetical protein